jgi:hypothetical protein
MWSDRAQRRRGLTPGTPHRNHAACLAAVCSRGVTFQRIGLTRYAVQKQYVDIARQMLRLAALGKATGI